MPVAEGHCEAPCVKSRSQNWNPTSWKSRPKSFQVSVLETASVKIQAPKLRSQVLKTMSWKPYPKISQVFLPGRPALPCLPLHYPIFVHTDRRTDTMFALIYKILAHFIELFFDNFNHLCFSSSCFATNVYNHIFIVVLLIYICCELLKRLMLRFI